LGVLMPETKDGTPGLPQKSPPVRFLQPLAPTQGGRGVWASCCPTGGVRGEEALENAHAARGSSPGDATRCTHPWRVQRGHRDGRRAAGRGRHGSGNPNAPWSGVVHRRPDGDACAGHAAGGYDRRSGASVAARVRPGKNGMRICTSLRITCGRFGRTRTRRCAAIESSADHGRRVCQIRLPGDCTDQGARSPSTSRC